MHFSWILNSFTGAATVKCEGGTAANIWQTIQPPQFAKLLCWQKMSTSMDIIAKHFWKLAGSYCKSTPTERQKPHVQIVHILSVWIYFWQSLISPVTSSVFLAMIQNKFYAYQSRIINDVRKCMGIKLCANGQHLQKRNVSCWRIWKSWHFGMLTSTQFVHALHLCHSTQPLFLNSPVGHNQLPQLINRCNNYPNKTAAPQHLKENEILQ